MKNLEVFNTIDISSYTVMGVPGDTLEAAVRALCERKSWKYLGPVDGEFVEPPEAFWAVDEVAYRAAWGAESDLKADALRAIGTNEELDGLYQLYEGSVVEWDEYK